MIINDKFICIHKILTTFQGETIVVVLSSVIVVVETPSTGTLLEMEVSVVVLAMVGAISEAGSGSIVMSFEVEASTVPVPGIDAGSGAGAGLLTDCEGPPPADSPNETDCSATVGGAAE
jgi:hypothetical protein